MAGIPAVTTPAQSSVQPRTFTAVWDDPGTGEPGYAPTYVGFNNHSDAQGNLTMHTMFLTAASSRVLGSGVTDPLLGIPNPPLTAGLYELMISSSAGPYGLSSGTPGIPSASNVSGSGTVGYFYSHSITPEVLYSSNGSATRPATGVVARAGAAGRAREARERAVLLDRSLPLRISRVRTLELYEQYRRNHRTAARAAR